MRMVEPSGVITISPLVHEDVLMFSCDNKLLGNYYIVQ